MLIIIISNFYLFNNIYGLLNSKKTYNFKFLTNIKKNLIFNNKKIFFNFKKIFLLKILKKKKHLSIRDNFFSKFIIINKNNLCDYLNYLKTLLKKIYEPLNMWRIKLLYVSFYYCVTIKYDIYSFKILIFII